MSVNVSWLEVYVIKWNHGECPYESKKLDDWVYSKDHYKWNPSMCDCECNKACEIDKYLDINNCSCE